MTVTLAAALAGFLVTSPAAQVAAVNVAGLELTHLLRAMALLKTMFAAGAVGATLWRLGAPVAWPRLGAYALACAAMAVSPGLIWDMAHVKAGALLLHGGLLASALMLWRDPAMAARLSAAVATRRARPR